MGQYRSLNHVMKLFLGLVIVLACVYLALGQQPPVQQPNAPKQTPAQPSQAPSPGASLRATVPGPSPQPTSSPQPTPFLTPKLPGPSPINSASPAAAPTAS